MSAGEVEAEELEDGVAETGAPRKRGRLWDILAGKKAFAVKKAKKVKKKVTAPIAVVKAPVVAISSKLKAGWGDYPEPPGKGGQVQYGCGREPRDCPYINRLKSDLANSYFWTGQFGTDYCFFVANWHPLFGIFLCHPSHPWTKLTRIEMFIIDLAITMVPSAVIMIRFTRGYWAYLEQPLIIICITIPDMIILILLYQLSVANTRCPNLAKCWHTAIKHCCMLYVFVIAAVCSGICYLIMMNSEFKFYDLFWPLVKGKLISYATWFPLWFFLPCELGFLSLWNSEKKKAAKAAAKAAAEQQEGQVIGAA